jgi:hypothetical protein
MMVVNLNLWSSLLDRYLPKVDASHKYYINISIACKQMRVMSIVSVLTLSGTGNDIFVALFFLITALTGYIYFAHCTYYFDDFDAQNALDTLIKKVYTNHLVGLRMKAFWLALLVTFTGLVSCFYIL